MYSFTVIAVFPRITFACVARRYIKMSSPNMNNVILAGAILAFTSMIFSGADNLTHSPAIQMLMCKVRGVTS